MLTRASNDSEVTGRELSPTRQAHPMYATRLMTEIYHLVEPGRQHTLCGLRVSRVTSERRTNTLQLVHNLTENLMICKHCERIRKQEYPATMKA